MKKKDNRGMSLVEIIMVIALMVVVTGVTGYGISLIGQKPVEECARKVEIALNQNRTNSMGKKEAYLEFYINDNCAAVKECWISAREAADREEDDFSVPVRTDVVIGANDVKLRFVYKNAEGVEQEPKEELGTTTTSVKVSFKRDSGSLVADESGLFLDRIEVYKGEGYIKTVSIDKLTGKVTLQ